MRKTVLTGLFACTLIFVGGASANAQTPENNVSSNNSDSSLSGLLAFQSDNALEVISNTSNLDVEVGNSENDKKTNEKDIENVHIVKEAETLSKIAKEEDTTWQRIFFKNKNISDPDVLSVGMKLIIPNKDEKLKKRDIPKPITKTVSKTSYNTVVSAPRGSSAGNGYVPGYCTWYVKNRRPDLPNNLGNAISWVSRASAQGFAVGSTPKVGAVGQRGNHVVYVEKVNKDGTVTISDMNHKGLYVKTVRTVPASYFTYIY